MDSIVDLLYSCEYNANKKGEVEYGEIWFEHPDWDFELNFNIEEGENFSAMLDISFNPGGQVEKAIKILKEHGIEIGENGEVMDEGLNSLIKEFYQIETRE